MLLTQQTITMSSETEEVSQSLVIPYGRQYPYHVTQDVILFLDYQPHF